MNYDDPDPVESLTNLYKTIDQHSEYDLRGDEGPEELAESNVKENAANPAFDIGDTDAVLEIGYEEGKDRFVGWVPHSLGPGIDSDYMPEDSFMHDLSKAQQQIAETVESDYVNHHEADPVHVVSLGTPVDYETEEMESTIDQIADASQEIEEMHRDLERVVQDRLE